MKKTHLKNRNGFSLVEIIIAMAMFAIVIVSVFLMFSFSSQQNHRTNDLDELYSIAQRSMEYIKNNPGDLTESASYRQLGGYTADAETLSRFTVIYKVTEIAVPKPSGAAGSGSPINPVNFIVTIEVYFTKDSTALGTIGTVSKTETARSLNIPIATLNSKLTTYR